MCVLYCSANSCKLENGSYDTCYNGFYRFQSFGGRRPYRPAEDVAFAAARFYEKGGTFQSYYMVTVHFLIESFLPENVANVENVDLRM
jgi:hypothetical protein